MNKQRMDTGKLQNILFTRKITEKHIEFGNQIGLSVEDHPFISIELNPITSTILEDLQANSTWSWIFTSRNAVKSLINSITDISTFKDRICYAVGNKTAEELRDNGFKVIVPENQNALSLVDLLEKDTKKNSYFYFTGNMRRKTITNYFGENEINFREVECYKTKLIQPEIEINKYKAICFCSPSAVVSFFQKYQVDATTVCTAIGNTTAVKLLDYTENVIMSEETNVYSMLKICNEYLNS